MKGFIATLATVGILLGSSVGAQTESAGAVATVGLEVAVQEPAAGDPQLTHHEALQAVLTSDGGVVVSPILKTAVPGTEGTATGFRAFHAYASLSEVVNDYWNALTRLGFEGSVTAASLDTTVYTFENGGRRVEATFTQGADGVTASLLWAQAERADLEI